MQCLQKLGPQKKERPGQGPQSVLQLPSSWPQNLCLHQQRNLSECKRRHHTTLHDPAKVVTPPAATTPASTNNTPSTEEVSNSVIRQPLLAAATASPMTLHEVHPTAAVTLWNQQISQPTRTFIFIDHGSAACLINKPGRKAESPQVQKRSHRQRYRGQNEPQVHGQHLHHLPEFCL